MKKILFLTMFFAGLLFTVEAQNKTVPIAVGNTYGFIGTTSSTIGVTNFTAADTIAAGRTTYTIQINSPQKSAATQDVLIKLANVAAGKATVQLQGAKFLTGPYANIETAKTWNGTTADTTIVYSTATLNRYQYYRVVTTRTAGKSKLTGFEFKLYL
jgi:hypothetical protein